MSAAPVILPMVWATAADRIETKEAVQPKEAGGGRAESGLAFYRKYTEALLRKYVSLSMGGGRVPSLLGRELFRGKVTNYRVHGFDDMVIFVQDVERCLEKLDQGHQLLIERIAMEEYTQREAAELLGLPLRSLERWYGDALDEVTRLFLERRILEFAKCCQEA
jgi:hypothetical protein